MFQYFLICWVRLSFVVKCVGGRTFEMPWNLTASWLATRIIVCFNISHHFYRPDAARNCTCGSRNLDIIYSKEIMITLVTLNCDIWFGNTQQVNHETWRIMSRLDTSKIYLIRRLPLELFFLHYSLESIIVLCGASTDKHFRIHVSWCPLWPVALSYQCC